MSWRMLMPMPLLQFPSGGGERFLDLPNLLELACHLRAKCQETADDTLDGNHDEFVCCVGGDRAFVGSRRGDVGADVKPSIVEFRLDQAEPPWRTAATCRSDEVTNLDLTHRSPAAGPDSLPACRRTPQRQRNADPHPSTPRRRDRRSMSRSRLPRLGSVAGRLCTSCQTAYVDGSQSHLLRVKGKLNQCD